LWEATRRTEASRLGVDQIKLLVERRFADPAALLRIEQVQ
jgi:hypothetical protein